MIIWISGPYGVGKTTLAEAMAAKMDNALVFDAEEVGNAVRGNYPGCPYGYIFEDYPLWGEFCYLDILVPMTLLRMESYSIIGKLKQDGIDTRLVVLEASWQTVHDRILARGEEEGCWCMENIELARIGSAALPGLHIQTDERSIDKLVEIAFSKLG